MQTLFFLNDCVLGFGCLQISFEKWRIEMVGRDKKARTKNMIEVE
jgi:hypothetical protein